MDKVYDMGRKIEWGPFKIKTEWVYDWDPHLDWIGEYTSNPKNEMFVDRKYGVVVGPRITIQFVKKVDEIEPYDGNSKDVLAWAKHQDQWWDWAEDFLVRGDVGVEFLSEYPEYEFEIENIEYDEDTHLLAVLANAPSAYIYDLPRMGSREHRYFESDNYPDFDEQNAKYLTDDYKRMCDYNDGDWCMYGCIVTIKLDGNEVGEASLWGIESDSDDDYFEEVEEDLISQAKHGLDKAVRGMKEASDEAIAFLENGGE